MVNSISTTNSLLTRLFLAFAVIAGAIIFNIFQPAFAADIPDSESASAIERIDSAWQIEIDPIYGWIPGMKGKLGVFGVVANVDVTPLDILGNLGDFLDVLQGFYMGSGELRYDRFGIQYDIIYVDIRSINEFESGLVSGGLDVGFGLAMGTLAGNYRVHETPTSYVDLFAGARITDVNLEVDVVIGPGGGVSGRDGSTWTDPIIGVKGRKDLTEHWYLLGSAMVGGFGVSSDYLYDAHGYVGYEWANGVSAYGGFRAADTRYKDGTFIWDLLMYGPVAGLKIRF